MAPSTLKQKRQRGQQEKVLCCCSRGAQPLDTSGYRREFANCHHLLLVCLLDTGTLGPSTNERPQSALEKTACFLPRLLHGLL
jgi:hypothetical protein